MNTLLDEIRSCTICEEYLPAGPRPIVAGNSKSKILIIGQAPGRRVHESGVPWDDPSGDQLRKWLNMDKDTFYNQDLVALMPMGFCYPGSGKSGDLPPRPECAQHWHQKMIDGLANVKLNLLVGQYAQKYYLGKRFKTNLTETVKSFKEFESEYLPLPHPSPRNRIWMKRNEWFEEEVIPYLKNKLSEVL